MGGMLGTSIPAWTGSRLVVLAALLVFGLGACAPSAQKSIRLQQNAGAPPGDLNAFFASEKQRPSLLFSDDYLAITVCGPKRETCNPYESDYLPAFFETLGPIRYSEPVKVTLGMTARNNYGYATGKGLVERWLSCFMPVGKERVYYFYSEDGKHSTAHVGVGSANKDVVGGTLFYRDPDDESYDAVLERCGPMEKTTEIVLPKA